MEPLLLLTHRIPYPPNKGDKVRSYHLLRHLAQRHRVVLGTFVDDPDDFRHVDALRAHCAEVRAAPLAPRAARLASARGLLSGEALSLPYYRDARLAQWVREAIARHGITQAVVFSSPMAQYVLDAPLRIVMDFCDVDSAKWSTYADEAALPMAWLYRREGARLLDFERAVARRAQANFFVTEAEAALFRSLAPESAANTHCFRNGVDTEYFSPAHRFDSPYAAGEVPLVFTGAMDYRPNIDAVTWFAREALARVRQFEPAARLWIVGMNPAPAVRALAGESISVTGRVADVRPFVQHARVVVAPLRISRGVQNKVLEAMAMGRAVVASHACAGALAAREGVEFEAAGDGTEFARRIGALLDEPERAAAMGRAARARVVADCNWARNLARVDEFLLPRAEPAAAPTTECTCPT